MHFANVIEYDLPKGVPHFLEVRDVFDTLKENIDSGMVGDLDRLIEGLAAGADNYVVRPRLFEDGEMRWCFALSWQICADEKDLSLFAHLQSADIDDAAYAILEFGLLLTLIAAALNRRPRWVRLMIGQRVEGKRFTDAGTVPLCKLTLDPRIAGRGLQTIQDAQFDDFRVA